MLLRRLALIAAFAGVGSPASAFAFSHGDVPNVASDKRAHEPIKERAHEAEHEGGVYHRPKGAKAAWWDNGGHEQHAAVYTSHTHTSTSAPSSKSHGGQVQHLAGGATVSAAPSRGRGRTQHSRSE